MLKRFAVKNYRGFSEKIEWDLAKHRDYEFNPSLIKNDIIKNAIIYGPNGSGKSSFGLAIFDIVNHLTQKWKRSDYYSNFIYAGAPKKAVEFEYEFSFFNNDKTEIVLYEYSKNNKCQLVEEKLTVNKTEIFHRAQNFVNLSSEFPLTDKVKDEISTIDNKANFSLVNYLTSTFPLPTGHYLLSLQNFVNSMLWFRSLEDRGFIGLTNASENIQEFIIKNNLVDDFSKFLESVSKQKFNFSKPNKNDKTLQVKIGENKIDFADIESTGTSSLSLLYYWIKHMNKASFVFIDEFDAFYHFKLSFEVCKILFDLDCQVFLTSHNTFLMTNDLLRPDCDFILKDNSIKAICDCTDKDLREGHNIEKLFRSGVFD